MRWFAWLILGYVALGLQIGLAAHARVGEAMVNLVLIAAVFVALNAPRQAALLGCFGLGVLHDLATLNPPGLFALSYGTLAVLASGTHRAVAQSHPITHFFYVLLGGVVTAIVLNLHGWLATGAAPQSLATWLASGFYSAMAGIPILWGLTRIRRAFKFRNQRNFSTRL